MYVWGKGPRLLVTLLVGADSKTAPGKDPGKSAVCMPACSGHHVQLPQRCSHDTPSPAEQCWEILRPLWARLALGFLPTAACLHHWLGGPL